MKWTALLILMLSLFTSFNLAQAEENQSKPEVRSINELTPAERAKYEQLMQTMHDAKEATTPQQPQSTQPSNH